MSLLFRNFWECNVYCTFVLFIYFCLLSTSLALAMFTFVPHANKALKLKLNERDRGVSMLQFGFPKQTSVPAYSLKRPSLEINKYDNSTASIHFLKIVQMNLR